MIRNERIAAAAGLIVAVSVAAGALGSCDAFKRGDQPGSGPAPTLVTSSLYDDNPHVGDKITNVPLRPRIMLRFSRPMGEQSRSVSNYALTRPGGAAAVGFSRSRVDPIERAVVLELAGPLSADTDYDLRIQPSADERQRLQAFDGAPFVGPVTIRFHTTADTAAIAAEPFDVPVEPCKAVAILSTCGSACCHGESELELPPALGLNLTLDSFIQKTAVGHASIQVQDPADPGGPGRLNPHKFPYGMPIIAPGSSAGSYLMYKLLMQPPKSSGCTGACGSLGEVSIDSHLRDVEHPGVALASELAQRLPGAPMPHPTRVWRSNQPSMRCDDPAGPRATPLSWADLQTIRAWIDDGARSCPCDDRTENHDVPLCDAGPDAADGG